MVLDEWAASASCGPPISPIIMMAFGLRILLEELQDVLEGAAVDGIAADTDAGSHADPEAFICEAAS